MKIPAYIQNALNDRIKSAEKFISADFIVSQFIDKYDIDVSSEDYYGGCESIVNPYDSAVRILDAIKNHKEKQDN